MSNTKDPKDQNDEKREKGHQDEDKERDDILGQLSERQGQEEPEKKEQHEESKGEEAPQEKSTSESEETEDIESLIDKRITDQPQSGGTAEEPVEELSAIQRIVGIFTQPQRVFEYLRAKPEFWVPIVVAIIISIISLFLISDIIVMEIVEKTRMQEDMTQQQIEDFEDLMFSIKAGPMKYIIILLFSIFGTLFILLIPTLIYWFIGNIILGGKTNFKRILSVFGYSYLIVSILGTIVKTPLILSKESLNVQTSLAVFLSQDSVETTLFQFLANFDIFIVWTLIVFSIGFATIHRFSRLKGIFAVFIPWLLYVVVSSVI